MNSGKIGEDRAVEYLKNKGYEILQRNFHSRFGEIDIIAQLKECIVFLEVKTRKSTVYGRPCEFVTPKKMEKIIKTAMIYLGNRDVEMRFDVIEVYMNNGICEIEHIENAFGGSYEIFSD